MKKQYLAVAFLAVALGITACSSKKADTESTTAQEVEGEPLENFSVTTFSFDMVKK